MSWQTLASRTVYENRWIRVREDDVIGPNGPGIYGVVEMRNPAVFVVAIDDEDRVCVVTLDRYATGTTSIEVPAGGTDGEAPLAAAQRELMEETGLTAEEWIEIGRMDALNGIAHAPEHVFLARGVASPEVGPATDAEAGSEVGGLTAGQREEGIQSVRWVPFAELLAMVGRGDISDGETIAALLFAGVHLGRFR
jgi:8-oxo-dGTP pyrophosphatase MutT (NUDIX family)